eukprot:2062144-Lingulodinium_polyedra.AAC.1
MVRRAARLRKVVATRRVARITGRMKLLGVRRDAVENEAVHILVFVRREQGTSLARGGPTG